MPNKDGKGPQGAGSFTGKGRGKCIKVVTEQEIAQLIQRNSENRCLKQAEQNNDITEDIIPNE